jgi:phage terminase large subunit-like protein
MTVVARRRRGSRASRGLPYTPVEELLNVTVLDVLRDPLGRRTGEALDPHRHSVQRLKEIFNTVGPRETASLWQQTPRPAEGSLFTRDSFQGRIIKPEDVPKDLKWVRFWDWAYSEEQVNKSDPDWSVGAKMALEFDRTGSSFTIWLAHIERLQKLWSDVKQRCAATAERDGQMCYVGGEAGGPQKAACDDILKMPIMAPYVFWAFPTIQDKVSKAQPWMDRARVGMMKIVEGEWNEVFFDEGEAFPNGNHDDIMDAVSGAYVMAANRTQIFDTEVKAETVVKRW